MTGHGKSVSDYASIRYGHTILCHNTDTENRGQRKNGENMAEVIGNIRNRAMKGWEEK